MEQDCDIRSKAYEARDVVQAAVVTLREWPHVHLLADWGHWLSVALSPANSAEDRNAAAHQARSAARKAVDTAVAKLCGADLFLMGTDNGLLCDLRKAQEDTGSLIRDLQEAQVNTAGLCVRSIARAFTHRSGIFRHQAAS
jgi:hypothetical protein